jgi:hypothetical protein
MSFDPSTAKPAEEFDPSTAKPAGGIPALIDYSPVAGVVEGAMSLGSGTAASALAGLSGLGQAATNALGLTTTPAGDRVQQVSEALTYAPRTKAGQVVTGAVAAPFELLAAGADKAGGAVTDATGSPAAGAALNTAIQGIPLTIGRGARAVPGESAASIAARQKAKALNAPQDAQIAAARKAGLALTPEEAGAGPIARGVGSLAGEPRLAKQLSKQNAPVINDMIRRDVGLPEDVPIGKAELVEIRKAEGAHYEAVKSVGRFDTDARFQADLHSITKSFDQAAKDFAHRSENPFKKTLEGLNVKSMDAASAVEEVKLLRSDADKAFRTGDKQLGGAYKEAAQALDNQLDRHLKSLNDPALAEAVTRYRAARERIAKTYAAEKALNETTGNIDAAKYAKALKDGKKLSGEGLQVGQFAQQFPRSTQRTERLGSTGPTIFDAALGLVFGEPIAGESAVSRGLSGLTARPLARNAMGSGPVQSAMTSPRTYDRSKFRSLQELLADYGTVGGMTGAAAGQR